MQVSSRCLLLRAWDLRFISLSFNPLCLMFFFIASTNCRIRTANLLKKAKPLSQSILLLQLPDPTEIVIVNSYLNQGCLLNKITLSRELERRHSRKYFSLSHGSEALTVVTSDINGGIIPGPASRTAPGAVSVSSGSRWEVMIMEREAALRWLWVAITENFSRVLWCIYQLCGFKGKIPTRKQHQVRRAFPLITCLHWVQR